MRALVVGDINGIFMPEFAVYILRKLNYEVDILNDIPKAKTKQIYIDMLEKANCNIIYPKEKKGLERYQPFLFLSNIRRYKICRDYDLICIQSVQRVSCGASIYKKRNTRLITTYYGSDILRARKKDTIPAFFLLKRTDVVTVESEYVKSVFDRVYKGRFSDKVKTVHLGSATDSYINMVLGELSKEECKKHFNIPADKISILCGYNGQREHRHLEILDSLNKLSVEDKQNIYLLFHFGYSGDEKYCDEIREKLKLYGLDGKIITSFFQKEEMAMFRKATDIMLNLQPTDAISNSMLESLAAGAVVVKGKWLKYPDLERDNRFLLDVDTIEELHGLIHDVINDLGDYFNKTMVNNGILEEFTWEAQLDNWSKVLSG